MNKEKFYDDPTNRVVAIFDDRSSAIAAKSQLIEFGFDKDRVHIYGEDAAPDVDTSAKWFADTDEDLKKFERELRDGCNIISIPVQDCECREEVHKILKANDARRVTHFGEWITEVLK